MVSCCCQVYSKLRSQFLGPLCLWQCLFHFSPESHLWCWVGVHIGAVYTRVCIVYTIASVFCRKHQCSVENTRAPSTPGGLVWSRPHYVNNIGLVIVKRALGLKRPRHDERVSQIISFLLAQISPSFFILFSQGHG